VRCLQQNRIIITNGRHSYRERCIFSLNNRVLDRIEG
jgi:hypothetical protein